jgi:hypothetical protein
MLRYLRIAFSAGCVVMCLLLIVLRVQSHFQYDTLELKTKSRLLQLRSWNGRLEFSLYNALRRNAAMTSQTAQVMVNMFSQGRPFLSRTGHRFRSRNWKTGFFGFGWQNTPNRTTVFAPYWFPILLCIVLASLAASPEIQWTRRFSLRTLLVVTTLVAVLLGSLTYVGR